MQFPIGFYGFRWCNPTRFHGLNELVFCGVHGIPSFWTACRDAGIDEFFNVGRQPADRVLPQANGFPEFTLSDKEVEGGFGQARCFLYLFHPQDVLLNN